MDENEFIIDEENGEGSSSNRSFLILAGLLLTTLIIGAICSGYFLFRPDTDSTAAQVAAIETQNAEIAVTNQAVTQTIAAMETENAEAAQAPPTATATILPPTNTPEPSATPVAAAVDNGSKDEGDEEDEPVASDDETATPNFSGTSAFEGTEEPVADEEDDSTPTPIPAQSEGDDNGDIAETDGGEGDKTPVTESEALPETGLSTSTGLLLAAVLIIILFAARRLRTT